MVKFLRETATTKEDLPHEFAGQAPVCDWCMAGTDDARHVAWEREQTAVREQASMTFEREIGS